MKEIVGRYNIAKVFTDNIEEKASEQIRNLCNQPFVQGSKIRIMPDTHAGAGCTIGTTMTISNKIVPNMVGVDIGCGMLALMIGKVKIDFEKLDMVIRNNIPSGFNVRDDVYPGVVFGTALEMLRCKDIVNINRAHLSVGTLGGGNHFIEVNVDEEGNHYLVIHSGSRNMGKQIAEYYQRQAVTELGTVSYTKIINDLKDAGRAQEIECELQKIKGKSVKVDTGFEYVEGNSFNDYLHDMEIAQRYAVLNRSLIGRIISDKMGFTELDRVVSIHNYIDMDSMILRKGAISAHKGERVIIPINMKDGSIIGIGKGNTDWNESAPHGAGRLMSRRQAKMNLSLENLKESMEGIYTTSLSFGTLDEAPLAYKPMEDIINNISDTVDIVNIIKPVYNFKASEY